jgi:hypothetical protein
MPFSNFSFHPVPFPNLFSLSFAISPGGLDLPIILSNLERHEDL